jgi:hypothetical protein
MKPWIVVAVFAVLGCCLYLLYVTSETPVPHAVSSSPSGGARSGTRAEAPAVTVRPSRADRAVPAVQEPAGSAGAQANEDAAGSASEVTVEEMRDHLEASFVAAPPAPSSELADRLESGVRAVLPVGSSVRSVACRGSLCRVETAHRAIDEVRDFVQRALQDPSRMSNGPAFVSLLEEPAPGKQVVVVIYVGREGTVLPMHGRLAVRDQPPRTSE